MHVSAVRMCADLCAERKNGAPGTTRTCDPLIRSQVLYPAELRVREGINSKWLTGNSLMAPNSVQRYSVLRKDPLRIRPSRHVLRVPRVEGRALTTVRSTPVLSGQSVPAASLQLALPAMNHHACAHQVVDIRPYKAI